MNSRMIESLLFLLFVIIPLLLTAILLINVANGIIPRYYATPKYIYNNTDLNGLGVTLAFICLVPFLYPYYVVTFIRWIYQKFKNLRTEVES